LILRESLRSTSRALCRAGLPDADLEAELLTGHVLGMSKTQLYTESERDLTPAEIEQLCRFVRQRLDHEPTAYILGHWEFYGINFCVDWRALVPRPETELLVEKAIELGQFMLESGRQIAIADIGTGCGAIAISLALALPQAEIYATDVSTSALQVAEMNCRRHAVNGRVKLLRGDLLEPLPRPVDMIVANLPYVRHSEIRDLAPEIRDYEPVLALDGGEDGLHVIQQMLEQMPAKLNREASCLLEVGQGQDEAVTLLIETYFPEARTESIVDLGGIARVVRATLRNR